MPGAVFNHPIHESGKHFGEMLALRKFLKGTSKILNQKPRVHFNDIFEIQTIEQIRI
jgi:hypothetical protein